MKRADVRRRRGSVLSSVAAVEVDAPGCSFNPDFEQHQDAVAAAVAAEVRKAIDAELQPLPPPRNVDAELEVDELLRLQVPLHLPRPALNQLHTAARDVA